VRGTYVSVARTNDARVSIRSYGAIDFGIRRRLIQNEDASRPPICKGVRRQCE
jgi:hypothetical protein